MGLKDLFIKSEEDNTQQSMAVPQVQQSSEPQEVKPRTVVTHTPSSIVADDNVVNTLWEAIVSAKQPSPDYLDLKGNVEALDELPISPEQKLVSAFKILRKANPNFKKEDLIASIDHYISVINDEKNKGIEELAEMRTVTIDNVQNEIAELKQKADDYKRQYDELIGLINSRNIKLTKAKNDIETKSATFNGSVENVLAVLNSDRANIMSINFS